MKTGEWDGWKNLVLWRVRIHCCFTLLFLGGSFPSRIGNHCLPCLSDWRTRFLILFCEKEPQEHWFLLLFFIFFIDLSKFLSFLFTLFDNRGLRNCCRNWRWCIQRSLSFIHFYDPPSTPPKQTNKFLAFTKRDKVLFFFWFFYFSCWPDGAVQSLSLPLSFLNSL